MISGLGALRVQGGTWTLSGTNSFSGGTTVTGGTLRLGGNGALPANGSVVLDPVSGGSVTLDVNGVSTAALGALTFRGAGGAVSTVTGGGTLNLGGGVFFNAASQPGPAYISVGTLALGSSSRVFNVGESILASTDLSITSVVSGTGGITKQGAGTLALLNGANLFSGPVVINDGTLSVPVTSALPAGANVTLDATSVSASLLLGGSSQSLAGLTLGASVRSQVARNSGAIGSGGVLTLGGTTAGSLTVYGTGGWYAARIGDEYAINNGQLNFNAGGSINVLRNASAVSPSVDLHVTAALAGTGAVQNTGPGAALFEGSGALLAGMLNVNQGTVLFGASFAPAAGATPVGGGVSVASGAVIGAGARTSPFSSEVVLAKAVNLNSSALLGSWDLDEGIRLNLAGQVTVQPAANSTAASLGLGGYVGTVVSGGFDA
ncbi:MAG: autotransporter-associated beta strand repeat-containing protein, partial [Opitutaceae bacterium]